MRTNAPKEKTLSNSQKAEFEAAKRKKFVLDKASTSDAYNVYFKWCDLTRFPFIRISPKKKYADVAVDMLTTNTRLNKFGQSQVKALFLTCQLKVSNYSIGSEICSIGGVPIKEAEGIAEKLLAIATIPEHIEKY